MSWYYAEGDAQKGPISQEELTQLLSSGGITSETLVWQEGMPEWVAYSDALSGAAPVGYDASNVFCETCGNAFPSDLVIEIDGRNTCADCKPVALQRLKEGVGGGSDASRTRNENLKHEASVKSVGILYLLSGGVMSLVSIIMVSALFMGSSRSSAEGMGFMAGIVTVYFVLAVVSILVGIGIRKLSPWTRVPVGILSGLGLLGFPIGTLINGYILWLFFSAKGATVFSPEYARVIEATPHIKYKTSALVWFFLILMVVLCGGGIIAGVMSGSR